MAVAFQPGQTVGRGDLDIFLRNGAGNPANAAEIHFALYYVDVGPPEVEVLIGAAQRTPVNPAVGEYYASLAIPTGAAVGTYRIRWFFKELVTAPFQEVAQEFAVVSTTTSTTSTTYTAAQTQMIWSLRVLLRDQHPDKFYHFRPPEFEGDIGQYNRIFGQIWEDAELLEYLQRSLDAFNAFPPRTGVTSLDLLVSQKPEWRTFILWGAIVHACFAMSMNWIADEFDYSIGGVSLSIEKSSKYESMKQNAETQFNEKAADTKVRTVKYIRGLQQPRFGLGVRSAFGPNVGRGVLSPRNFVVLPVLLTIGSYLGTLMGM